MQVMQPDGCLPSQPFASMTLDYLNACYSVFLVLQCTEIAIEVWLLLQDSERYNTLPSLISIAVARLVIGAGRHPALSNQSTRTYPTPADRHARFILTADGDASACVSWAPSAIFSYPADHYNQPLHQHQPHYTCLLRGVGCFTSGTTQTKHHRTFHKPPPNLTTTSSSPIYTTVASRSSFPIKTIRKS